MTAETDFVVLGAGLTGLAAANEFANQAIVIEQSDRPGGLVKTENFNGYWFDHVIHVLHFKDPALERRLHRLLGSTLGRCKPVAFVETDHGTTRFPLQTHLRGLDRDAIVRCLGDFAEASFRHVDESPHNYEQLLLQTFGRSICEIFLFPYNRKMWKRPLNGLATAGFTWNISAPDYQQVLRGALQEDSGYEPYNDNGWYPRPPRDAPLRGMEVLSDALADGVSDLRLGHRVVEIDVTARVVIAEHNGRRDRFHFRQGCLSSLPLPVAVGICRQAPLELQQACLRLTRNRVRTVTFSLRGPRPINRGMWRYYADESVLFTRLIHMHEFDPLSAPDDGWSVMAEVTERAEDRPMPDAELIRRVRTDLHRVGAVPDDCQIIDEHVLMVDPAYVVFTTENQSIIEAARRFLISHGITPMGRFGRWEYSSMAQVMRDGFGWAREACDRAAARGRIAPLSA